MWCTLIHTYRQTLNHYIYIVSLTGGRQNKQKRDIHTYRQTIHHFHHHHRHHHHYHYHPHPHHHHYPHQPWIGGSRDPRDILGFAACLFSQRLPGDTDHIDHLLIIRDCLVIQIILIICWSADTEFWWQESAIIILIIVHYVLIIDHMLDWLCYYKFIICLIDYAVKRWSHAWLVMLLHIAD